MERQGPRTDMSRTRNHSPMRIAHKGNVMPKCSSGPATTCTLLNLRTTYERVYQGSKSLTCIELANHNTNWSITLHILPL
jgi:hypothetical protein